MTLSGYSVVIPAVELVILVGIVAVAVLLVRRLRS